MDSEQAEGLKPPERPCDHQPFRGICLICGVIVTPGATVADAASDPVADRAAVEPVTERAAAPEQPALLPMSDDELRTAGRTLASLEKEYEDTCARHALLRTQMKAQRDNLRDRISAIAGQINTQGR